MFKLGLGKYRKILVLIALFLVFDLGVLGLTFVISNQISADAVSLNLAGQQRTLVQQMTKAALLLQEGNTQGTIDSGGQSSFSELKELFTAVDAFNVTLNAFDQGGQKLENGTEVALTPQEDIQAKAFLTQLKELWQPVNAELQNVKKNMDKGNVDLGPVLLTLVTENQNLLDITTLLTSRMEVISGFRASRLRAIQIGGIALALINFAFILYNFLGQLRRSDRQVEEAQRETSNILRTTQDGLFLLDEKGVIGTQTSQSLARILGMNDLPGANFLDMIKPMVTEKTYDTAKEYIELLMRHDVKEKLVASLNPLDCLEINTPRPNGVIETRFLQFNFNRVLEGTKVTNLLVTVNDISRRIRLERELKESERKVQDQMGMMVHLLQADPQLLQEFLRNATKGLDEINVELKNNDSDTVSKRIELIFRIAHRMKGDATALRLETLAQSLHAFEGALDDVRKMTSITNEDLLPVAVRVKSLYTQVQSIQDTLSRIAQVRGVVSVEAPKPANDPTLEGLPFVRQWRAFAEQLAERAEKKVEVSYQGLHLENIDANSREAITSIVNQFLRNSLVHGIESPAERKLRGKSEAGRIAIYVSDQRDGNLELSFRDDGAGINTEKIRDAALRAGRLSPEEAKTTDPRALISLIFEPGISTRETTDEDAGRGVGLDAVKDLVTRMGGRVRIGTSQGEYCHFRVQLPLLNTPTTETSREAA